MRELAGYVDGLPNLCGSEQRTVGGPDLRTAAIIGNLRWMLEYSSPSSEP